MERMSMRRIRGGMRVCELSFAIVSDGLLDTPQPAFRMVPRFAHVKEDANMMVCREFNSLLDFERKKKAKAARDTKIYMDKFTKLLDRGEEKLKTQLEDAVALSYAQHSTIRCKPLLKSTDPRETPTSSALSRQPMVRLVHSNPKLPAKKAIPLNFEALP